MTSGRRGAAAGRRGEADAVLRRGGGGAGGHVDAGAVRAAVRGMGLVHPDLMGRDALRIESRYCASAVLPVRVLNRVDNNDPSFTLI